MNGLQALLNKDSFWFPLLGTVSGLGLLSAYIAYNKKKEIIKQVQFVKRAKVYQLKQFLENHKNRIQNTSGIQQQGYKQDFLIKLVPRISQIQILKNVYSNQIEFCPPSLNPMIKDFIKTYNSQFQFDNPVKKNLMDIIKYREGLPIGRLQTNLFDQRTQFISRQQFKQFHQNNLKTLYERDPNSNLFQQYRDQMDDFKNEMTLTIFQSLWKTLSFFVQSIGEFFTSAGYKKTKSTKDTRRPFLKGIFSGMLRTNYSLVKDTYLLLKVRVQGKQISSQVISDNKSRLIEYYMKQIFNLNMKINILSGIVLVLSIYPAIRLYKFLKIALQKVSIINKKYLNPKQISDDKLCQICYTNCRNIIFYGCKHLIMCYECLQSHPQDKCILCSTAIQKSQMIYDDSNIEIRENENST